MTIEWKQVQHVHVSPGIQIGSIVISLIQFVGANNSGFPSNTVHHEFYMGWLLIKGLGQKKNDGMRSWVAFAFHNGCPDEIM